MHFIYTTSVALMAAMIPAFVYSVPSTMKPRDESAALRVPQDLLIYESDFSSSGPHSFVAIFGESNSSTVTHSIVGPQTSVTYADTSQQFYCGIMPDGSEYMRVTQSPMCFDLDSFRFGYEASLYIFAGDFYEQSPDGVILAIINVKIVR